MEQIFQKQKRYIQDTILLAILMGIFIGYLITLQNPLANLSIIFLGIYMFFRSLNYKYISSADEKELKKIFKV